VNEQDKRKADQKNQSQNQPKKGCCDSNEECADVKATAVKPEPQRDNARKAQQKPASDPDLGLKHDNGSRPQSKPGNAPKPQLKR